MEASSGKRCRKTFWFNDISGENVLYLFGVLIEKQCLYKIQLFFRSVLFCNIIYKKEHHLHLCGRRVHTINSIEQIEMRQTN